MFDKATIKTFGPFFKKFFKAPIHYGTLLAIIAVIIVWYILNKTVLGYELKAVGLNREASEYGGINSGKKIVQSMAISGAICALAGVTQILGFTYALSIISAMDNYGFDGLAVSLLAGNNPIGVIFSGLFFGSLKYAGSNIQRVMGVPTEIINIIIGTIILFTAVPLVFRIIRAKHKNRKEAKNLAKEEKLISQESEKSTVGVKEKETILKDHNEKENELIKKDKQVENGQIKKETKLVSNSSKNVINETGEEIIVRTVESEEE